MAICPVIALGGTGGLLARVSNAVWLAPVFNRADNLGPVIAAFGKRLYRLPIGCVILLSGGRRSSAVLYRMD